jgi:molybdopterin-biosynthesis enzyme MoeA-like protein
MTTAKLFGLLIIGDEILCGKRADRHFSHVLHALQRRGMQLAWSRVAGDDPHRLVQELKLTQEDDCPVFCFGGIGATPDDNTRRAAAEAFGTELVRHPEAAALIEQQFGEAAYPNRIMMADLPKDSLLIPNPYNRIPGFMLYEHYFFPGFPEMAWPMLEWVLESYYPAVGPTQLEKSVRVAGVPESDLMPLMTALIGMHPDVKLFSLPRLEPARSVEIGFRGTAEQVDAALSSLVQELEKCRIDFEFLDGAGASPAGISRHRA